MQALDLIVTVKGPFAVANTSQSLHRMPVIYEGAPLMTLTFGSQFACGVCSILHVIASAPTCFKRIQAGRLISAHMPAALSVGTLGCLSKSKPFQCFRRKNRNRVAYWGAECMLLMGVNLEDMDFEKHFSNTDSCLQIIWKLMLVEWNHPSPLTCN